MSERTATRRRKSSSKPKKPVPITRKATFVGGWDLAPNVPDTKLHGTANPVTRTTLNSATLIKGGPTVYFKPVGNDAQFAVAATRLARALDMEDVISHNAFSHMNGQDGVVSGQVPGVPLRTVQHEKETQVPDDYKNPQDVQLWLDIEGARIMQKDGKYFELSGYVQNPVDYKDPRIQKGMSDLQIFDAISGQIDRHGGNIFVDPQTGRVTGIDDDSSMKDLPWGVAKPYKKYPGLAPLVDRRTAQKILALRPEGLPNYLGHRENDLKDLKPEQIRAAEKRLSDVQAYLRTLQDTPAIVDTWNDATFATLMADPDKSYLGIAERDLQEAMAHQPIDGIPTSVGAPLDAPPPPRWAAKRPTVGGAQPIPSNVPTTRPRPAFAQTRPQPGVQRLRGEQPDDQQLINQQTIDDFDSFPALPATPRSSARAAASRLVSKQPRRDAPEKEKEVSPPPTVLDSSESSESDDTIARTQPDDPPQGGGLTVSQSPDNEPTDLETQVTALEDLVRELTGGAISPRRDIASTDVGSRLKELSDVLLQLTGGTRDE